MYSKEEQKKAAAWQAAMEVEDNMVLGLGTGSTVYYLMENCPNESAADCMSMGQPLLLRRKAWPAVWASPLSPWRMPGPYTWLSTGWTLLTRISIPLRAEAVPVP